MGFCLPSFLPVLFFLVGFSNLAGAVPPLVPTNDPYCAVAPPGNGRIGPGTARMVARLQELLRQANPHDSAYLNVRMAEQLRAAIPLATNMGTLAQLRVELAQQLVRAGNTKEGLKTFNELPGFLAANQVRVSPRNRFLLELERGVAYLRLGEVENCQLNHTSDSCIFPIQKGGVHQLQSGSRSAMGIFQNLLRQKTNDLGARWLFNIAAMTVGDYPDQVPPELLIPPGVFASDYPMPRFPDVAAATGTAVDDLAGGVVAEDFDGDDLLDLLVSSWSLEGQLRFFHNNGDGTFTERTREAGLMGLTGSLNMMQMDYNNDGKPDVFLLRGAWLGRGGHHPNSLLRNNGDGTFEDVTEAAGLLSFHPTQTATWFDFDGDGWIDVFIGNESSGEEHHPCELYHNNGNGTFTECAAASGVAAQGFIKGVASGDFDNDGRPDLYLSSRSELNILLHNDGPAPGHSKEKPAWRFSDVTEKAGVAGQRASFPTWFFDYDNDGWLDIFVTGYSASIADIAADYLGLPHQGERARLFHNNRNGTFTDVTKEAGLYKVLHAMGANFGDLDNDGWLDFYLGTGDPDFATLIPNRAFRNNGGKNFQDVTTATGTGHLQKGHAVAFADLDNNGNQDIYAVMGGAYTGDNYRNALFLNPINTNHWITLKLEGVRSNRAALGARICVNVETAAGPRAIYKTVSTGGSFGASPLRQEIGLGQARSIQSVEISWPATGQTQTLTNLGLDQFYRVKEGATQAEPWNVARFHLATNVTASLHLVQPHLHQPPKSR